MTFLIPGNGSQNVIIKLAGIFAVEVPGCLFIFHVSVIGENERIINGVERSALFTELSGR
jgi:hypothetical protein